MNFVDLEFREFAKKQRKNGATISIPEFNGNETEFQFFQSPKEVEYGSAKVVEGDGSFVIKEVKSKLDVSAFSYFLDGIERKKVFIINNCKTQIPVTYGYVAAVIMKRINKQLHSIDLNFENTSIYLPFKETGIEPDFYFSLDEIGKTARNFVNVGIVDVKGKRKDFPLYPLEIEQMAHSAIQTQRGNFEKDLVKIWLNKGVDDGWLFVDGRLDAVSTYLSTKSQIVGVIKSHRRYYFDYQEQFKIFNMKKDFRSSVFRPDNDNVYSWYLRIHEDKSHGNTDIGIIRVEIPAKDELLKKVDEISKWILLERNPVAFPASRWDRMIYPIKYCEDYLKSKAPSYTKLESLI